MRTEGYFASSGAGDIHYCRWEPEGQVRGVFQIIHGIAEYVERYDEFARYLNDLGYVVVAEDHMGHGKSVLDVPGCFTGGWNAAVEDSYALMKMMMEEFPQLPFVLLGHSMGSFMARSILCKYPDSGIAGCILVGTDWQPRAGLPAARALCQAMCLKDGERVPSPFLEKLIFGSYNKKVEHPRTQFDWLTRDQAIVDAYIAHPRCGFTVTTSLMRDLMDGHIYIEDPKNLARMKKDLPVLFLSGGDDPVGSYGKGVRRAFAEFQKAGMEQVSIRIYPLCRHELLNEINRQEVFGHIAEWLKKNIK